MDALTIHEAAATTGWSPRMLRYVERVGLVEPARSAAGYRLYGPAELQRLRTLRELLERARASACPTSPSPCACATSRSCAAATDAWLEAEAERPADVPPSDWLRFEQEKHQRLLAALAAHTDRPHGDRMTATEHRPDRLQGRRHRPRRLMAARRSSSPSTRCPA